MYDRPRRRPGPPLGSQNHKKDVRGSKYQVYLLPDTEAYLRLLGNGSRSRGVAILVAERKREGQP